MSKFQLVCAVMLRAHKYNKNRNFTTRFLRALWNGTEMANCWATN